MSGLKRDAGWGKRPPALVFNIPLPEGRAVLAHGQIRAGNTCPLTATGIPPLEDIDYHYCGGHATSYMLSPYALGFRL